MNIGREVEVIQEGARVRLRPGSPLAKRHPDIARSVGVVGSIVHGASLTDPGHGATMHVRYADLNLVALSVSAADVEAVDHLIPELRTV